MSHIVKINTEIRDATAVRAACQRRQLPVPVDGTHKLFSGEATGLAVQLPDWRYPVVSELTSGQVLYDNYEGRWGNQQHLDAFLQNYAVEKARIESRKQGHTVTEQQLADGSVKLTINMGRCRVKTIEVIVSPNGETKVETKGCAGSECREASKFIEQALGQRTDEQLTAEFHQSSVLGQECQQKT